MKLNSFQFQILCTMSALPVAKRFRWILEKKPTNGSSKTTSSSSAVSSGREVEIELRSYKRLNATASVLNFNKMEKHIFGGAEDFGIVKCFAENDLGEAQEPCVYKVIPAGSFQMNKRFNSGIRNLFV